MQKTVFYRRLFWLIIPILLPLIFTGAYVRHLLVLTLIYGILALSLDIIIGHMGQFSLGHQVFFGIGAYTTAILTTKYSMPVWIGFFSSIFFSAVCGLLIGVVSLRRARGVYLAIITLGLGKIGWLVAMKWVALTGGNRGVREIPHIAFNIPYTGPVSFDSEISYYYFSLGLLFLVTYIIFIWTQSRSGRAISAIRNNEELSSSIGIYPYKYYVWTFTFACSLAGLAGAAYAHYMVEVSPVTMSMHYMFWVLVMVLVGGMRTYLGPVLGAVMFVFLPEWLSATQELRMVIIGLIVLLVTLFMPQGIVPSVSEIFMRLGKKLSQ